MDIQKKREAFEREFKTKWEIGHFILKMVEFVDESQDYAPVNAVKQLSDEYYWVLALNTGWWAWQAAKAQTPVKLDRDTARQKLAMMWRGESTEINGRTVIFNESGCFDVRQDFGSGHFSQSLKATLDYLFQQRQSL